MIVAGLDGATRSGLAILDGERLIHWEAHRPKGDEDAEVFANFRNWLRSSLVSFGVEYAACEEPLRTNFDEGDDKGQGGFGFKRDRKKPAMSMRTFLRLYGIRAHAIEVFHTLNISFVEVNNKTWRSHIYGPCSPPRSLASDKRSDWWKQKALTHCSQIMKWEITSKDAAEAACIAEWRRCQLNPRLQQANDLFAQGAMA